MNRHTCILDDGGNPGRKCQACEQEAAKPTEQPDGQGRLLLNAYGRRCWEAGYQAALRESINGGDKT
jgi:hypothetical protein